MSTRHKKWVRKFPSTHFVNSDETGVPLLRVGEQDEVRLAIRVKNEGEDAHEAELSVLLPKALPFLNSEVMHLVHERT